VTGHKERYRHWNMGFIPVVSGARAGTLIMPFHPKIQAITCRSHYSAPLF